MKKIGELGKRMSPRLSEANARFFPTMTRLILSLENLKMTVYDESATNEIKEGLSDEAEQK